MPYLTATGWLQAGLIFILLVLLALYMRRRWHRARLARNHYRTANGSAIDSQTRAIQQQPMATRRVRPGHFLNARPLPTPHSMPSALHLVKAQRAQMPGTANTNQARIRGTEAAIFDMGHQRQKRQGSPYTIGSAEHCAYMQGYQATHMTKTGTVQTSAQSAEEPAAA